MSSTTSDGKSAPTGSGESQLPTPLWKGNRIEIYPCSKDAIGLALGLAASQPLQEVKVRATRTDPKKSLDRDFLCPCGKRPVVIIRPLWDPGSVDVREGGTRASNDSSTSPPIWRDCLLVSLERLADEVRGEHVRQLIKWGIQSHSPAEWFLILGEEIGELGQAICATQWPEETPKETVAEHVHAEAIQVATLALKIAEMTGVHA